MRLQTGDLFKHINSDMCVYLDDQQLKQLQNLLLTILRDVVAVCEKHNITYTLGGGSALGAIRHNGFIPWDDDIDLNMPREDHDRFIPLFLQEFGHKYWVHTPEHTQGYNLLYTRIRLKGTSVITRDDFYNNECGALLDIFVIENTFNNKVLRNIHGVGTLALGLLHSCRKFYRDKSKLFQIANGQPELLKAIKKKAFIGFFTAFLSIQTWTRLADRWNRVCKDCNSHYVAIPVGRKHFFGELYLREDVCRGRKESFDGLEVYCPIEVEKYLTALYGNYMDIPTDEKREKHAYLKPFNINVENKGEKI